MELDLIARLLTESAPLRKLVHFIALWTGEYEDTLECAERYLVKEIDFPSNDGRCSVGRASLMITANAPTNMRWLAVELRKLRTIQEKTLAWVLLGIHDERFPQLQEELLAAFPAQVRRPITIWCDEQSVAGFSEGVTCMSVYQELQWRFGDREIHLLLYVDSGEVVPFSPEPFDLTRRVSVKFLDV